MVKRHFAQKSWKIKRKGIRFITKPSHSKGSLPINVILRDILNYASTNSEVKFILQNRDVRVDGIRRKDYRFPIGLFDVFSLNDINEHFRVVFDKNGRLKLIKIDNDESRLKPCKIIGKKMVKGKIQLNLYDGKNKIVTDNNYKVDDTILLNLHNKEVKDHISLNKDTLVYLIGGKHISQTGNVQDIMDNRIIYKTNNGQIIETLKSYTFPIGKDKPLITLKI